MSEHHRVDRPWASVQHFIQKMGTVNQSLHVTILAIIMATAEKVDAGDRSLDLPL